MTVEELIEHLNNIEDKSKRVILDIYEDNSPDDVKIHVLKDIAILEQ